MADVVREAKCDRCIKNEMAQLAVDTLYDASDAREAMHSILAFIGSWYDLSRIYLIDFKNAPEEDWTYYWTPRNMRGSLRDEQVHKYELMGFYRKIFHENPMLVVDDFSKADERTKKALGYRQAKAILQYALIEDGQMIGFLGMDDCTDKRRWSQEEKDCIRLAAKIVLAAQRECAPKPSPMAKDEQGTDERFAQLMDCIPSDLYIVDAKTHEVLFANRSLREKLPQDPLGKPCYRTIVGREKPCDPCPIRQGETIQRYDDHLGGWRQLSQTPIPWEGKRQACLIRTDEINEQYRYQRQLEKMAYEDALLGIPNREGCKLLAHRNIKRVIRNGAAILMVDIQNLKQYNDRFGYEYGDGILRTLLEYFYSIGLKDKVFRWGGDEFIIELMGYSQQMALEMAEKILERMERPFYVLGVETRCKVDIALVMAPEQGEKVEDIISNLEYALAWSKRNGKRGTTIFSTELESSKRRQEEIAKILQTAVPQDKVRVFYQPIVDADGFYANKMEALARIYDERLGYILAEEFAPIAEQTGVMHEITRYVLEQICIKMKQLQGKGISFDCIGTDISAAELAKEGCSQEIFRILQDNGGTLSKLVIEVPEGALAENLAQVKRTLEELAGQGVRIALDNFGKGSIPLFGWIDLPLYAVKVDQPMKIFSQDQKRQTMFKGMIALIRKLGWKAVCKGVETAEQLDWALQAGCDSIQGLYFSRPVPEGEMERMLMQREAGRLREQDEKGAKRG